jgi:HTH-type transcriptional regulator / antitoxin HipB
MPESLYYLVHQKWHDKMSIRTPADLGASLRQHRENAGLTQEQLAVRVGTTQARISRLERGDGALNVRTLLQLMSAIGVQMEIRPSEKIHDPIDQDEDDEIDLDAIVNTGLKSPRRTSQR